MDKEKMLRDVDAALEEADHLFHEECDGTYGERIATLQDIKSYLEGKKVNLLCGS